MVKRLILLSVPLLIGLAVLYTEIKATESDAPNFCVTVVQDAQPNTPVPDARVIWYQNGQEIRRSTTGSDGRTCVHLPAGTYDVYAYYPPPPNSNQSGKLLNYNHVPPTNVTIMLSPPW
ncbi:MAG: carboxypeptidase-like regulatory domain-containing protein [Ignavibacteria bacterium]|nr:carboxypeptidase-like regulatory domain-containing protein [Ignavibacteria bacterium]